MGTANPGTGDESRKAFEDAAQAAPRGIVSEFVSFLRHHKKWWLLPILLVLLVVGVLLILAASGAGPLLYPLF
jgi:hypothetical protein